jgi:hypothetical protein
MHFPEETIIVTGFVYDVGRDIEEGLEGGAGGEEEGGGGVVVVRRGGGGVVLHTSLFGAESSPTLTRTRLDGSKLYDTSSSGS